MSERFDTILTARSKWFDIDFQELWKYRDLIFMFVRRNFVAQYKQTILGPAWALLKPLLSTVVFTVVFGNLAKLPTDGVPPFLFYLCSVTAWDYFSGCLNSTASTFIANARLMGKVYFPRLVMPISSVCSQLIGFFIQMLMFAGFLIYYSCLNHTVYCTQMLWLLPLVILNMAVLGLGCGIIISSLTTKYRDLGMLVAFLTRLWMYATPVVYSLELVPQRWRAWYLCNPMAVVLELFRGMFFGTASLGWTDIALCVGVTLIVTAGGVLLFNRVEKNFMDTI